MNVYFAVLKCYRFLRVIIGKYMKYKEIVKTYLIDTLESSCFGVVLNVCYVCVEEREAISVHVCLPPIVRHNAIAVT